MAVTCVGVGTGQSTSSNSVASTSITPAANKLYLAIVVSRAAAAPNIPTAAGCGLTWVQVATRVDNSNFRRITVFRAMKASGLSAGAVTATISGSQTVALISILELDGVNITGTDGSGAIVTSAQNGATGNVASPVSITMSAWGDAVNNAAVAAYWHGNAEVSTPKSGWTEVSDQAGISSTSQMAQFKVGQDTTPQFSWAGSTTTWGGIAVEIAGVPAVVYTQTPSGGLVLGGSTALSKAFDLTQSGGIVLGGSCSTALGHGYDDTPSGGIVFTAAGGLTGGGIDANTVLMLHLDEAFASLSGAISANSPTSYLYPSSAQPTGPTDGTTAGSSYGGPTHVADGPFTWLAWVKLAASDIGVNKLMLTSCYQWFGFYVDIDGTVKLTDSVTTIASSSVKITDTNWHMVALTKNGATTKIYVDGADVTVPGTNVTGGDTAYWQEWGLGWTYMGGWEIGVTTNGGRMSNITLWSTSVRSAAEIAGYYNFTAVSIVDSSSYAHPVTPNGNAKYSVTQAKFGGTTEFDGSGDFLSTPDAPEFDFSGQWTVDLWMYARTATTANVFGKRGGSGMSSPVLVYTTGGSLRLYMSSTQGSWDIASNLDCGTAPTGVWIHVAVVRYADGSVKYFRQGVQTASLGPTATPIDNAYAVTVGGVAGDPSWFDGWIDEVRFSTVARWSSNFTPPTAPYSVPSGSAGSSVLVSLARDVTPSGGIILNGSVVSDWTGGTVTYNLAPSGGIVLGGTQANTKAVSVAQTGGIVLGGSVSQTLIRAVTPSGGIVLGGSVAVTTALTINVAPSGGVVLGGSVVTQIGGATSVSPIGGIVLGGSCVTARTFPAVPTGGIVLGGTCTTVRSVVITVAPSGGIVLGGSVVTTLIPPGPTYTLTPGGGLVLGGTCTSSTTALVIYTSTPSGGIRLDGLALVSQAAVIFPISDLSDGTWTDQVGGSNLWAAIDETSPSDADYIKSATSPVTADICQVEFPGTYDPQLSTGHALTYRYGSDQEGWTTVTQVLTGAQADAISDYNHLSVKFEAKS